ncbi:MAG: LytTR family DNA-binding domain-containing protein [Bacteroidota bacterium]
MKNTSITAIIVDDEANGRAFLQKMLSEFCPEVELLGMAESAAAGEALIREHKPELVFLDVQMPFATGFDMLQKIGEIDFDVIFTTAHDNYAIRAIKFSALDYLLKPIDITELQEAVGKALVQREARDKDAKMENFLNYLKVGEKLPERLALPASDGLIFVQVADIVRCEADGAYTKLYLLNAEKIMISRNLKGIEQLLAGYRFFRVHHSHLINLDHVRKYVRGKGGHLLMEDGVKVDVSVRRKESFMQALSGQG